MSAPDSAEIKVKLVMLGDTGATFRWPGRGVWRKRGALVRLPVLCRSRKVERRRAICYHRV